LPATKAIPKEMLPLVDKPLIQYVVNECIAAGITEIVLVTPHGELFRYGGEEFVIIFEDTSPADAQIAVTAIRETLKQHPVHLDNQKLTVTVSIGISALQPTDINFDSWFKRVDHYLYLSKQSGRNRMTVEGQTRHL